MCSFTLRRDLFGRLVLAVLLAPMAMISLACDRGSDVELSEAEAIAMIGTTPLHYAALLDRGEDVTAKIKAGADPNAKDKVGQTPLHVAAAGGCKAACEALIANGADLLIANEREQLPIHLAADEGHVDIVALLLDNGTEVDVPNGGGQSALLVAASSGQTEVAALLIERGADVNFSGGGGFRGGTPLHRAAFQGHIPVVELLVEKGADVNGMAADRGRTPIDLAISHGNHGIADYLRERGGVEGPSQPRGQRGRQEGREGGQRRFDFARLDQNSDGKITRDEFRGPAEFFDRLDENDDGEVTAAEAETLLAAARNGEGDAPQPAAP